MRILIIEDDLKIAEFIVKGLKAEGFAVDHADSGPEGLDMALVNVYDTLVVDIMLPGQDGISVIQTIRNKNNNTPIIILSARNRVEDRVDGLRAGADDYLTKPFSFSELLARIQALIRRAGNVTDPVNLSYADLTLDIIKRQVRRGSEQIELQPLEFSLLE